MIGPVLNNMRETEIWLENEVNEAVYLIQSRPNDSQVSDLDWTVVRPAGLTNNCVTDKQFTVREDYHVRQTLG